MQRILAPDTEHGLQVISPELFANMQLYSEYSAAASCAPKFFANWTGTNVYCDPGECPILETLDTWVLGGLGGTSQSSYPGNATGYIAVDYTNHVLVFAYRGSRTEGEYKVDQQYKQQAVPEICQGCQVHSGFYNDYKEASSYVLFLIDYMVNYSNGGEFKDYPVVLTGHSLGGALATLTAALPDWNIPISVYTYGCPELGNREFAEFLTTRLNCSTNSNCRNVRLTHTNDPIPKILSTSIIVNRTWQYSTMSPEYWITSGDGVPVTTQDIQYIEGIDNTTGNLGTKGRDCTAHNWYFGNMTGCAEYYGPPPPESELICPK